MARQPSTSTGNPGSAPAAQQFDARRSGATEGVTRSGEQTVFAGSEAKGSEAKGSEGKDAAGQRSTDGATVSPATGSATGNLWSGFAPETSSSLAAADASAAPQDSGVSSQAISMAVLGIGLVGLLGGFLVAGVRRQRVHAGRTSGRNER